MSEFNHPTMITPLQTGKNFWSTGKSNSRRTALGATAIFVVLALICAVVWLSPSDSIVRKVAADVVKPISTNVQLKDDRANLLSQLVSQKSAMSTQSAKMADQTKQLDAALGKVKALEAQLASAKKSGSISAGQAASYKAQLMKLEASLNASGATTTLAGSSSGGSAASNTPSTTGTPGTPNTPTVVTLQTPSKADLLSPANRYFGLYTAQSPFSFSEFNEVATQVGAEPNVAGYFQGWDKPFRADAVNDSWVKGDLPMMTWESQSSTAGNNDVDQSTYSLSNIISGKFDAYLKTYADAIVSNGHPLAIRLDQEMNASWYPWSEGKNHNATGSYADMWKHVWNIFQAEGANQYVIWDWSPNRVDNLSSTQQTLTALTEFYPGDQYVDWVGMSGYERPNGQGVQQNGTFDATFGKTLTLLRQLTTKKIFLSEVGAAEEGAPATATTPSLKQTWITNLFAAMADQNNSDIIGFNWFNLTVTTNVNQELASNDWRITSTAASVAAFKAGIARTDIGYKLKAPTP